MWQAETGAKQTQELLQNIKDSDHCNNVTGTLEEHHHSSSPKRDWLGMQRAGSPSLVLFTNFPYQQLQQKEPYGGNDSIEDFYMPSDHMCQKPIVSDT